MTLELTIVEHFVNFVKQNVVKLDAVAEALLTFEHDLDIDIRLVVLAFGHEIGHLIWKLERQVEHDAVECLGVADEFLVLHQITTAKFRRVHWRIESNFVLENASLRIAVNWDGVCASCDRHSFLAVLQDGGFLGIK